MDAGSFNVVQVFIDKRLADLPQGAFDLMVLFFDQRKLVPGDIGLFKVGFRQPVGFEKCFLVHPVSLPFGVIGSVRPAADR